jgi:hypothetical protein
MASAGIPILPHVVADGEMNARVSPPSGNIEENLYPVKVPPNSTAILPQLHGVQNIKCLAPKP